MFSLSLALKYPVQLQLYHTREKQFLVHVDIFPRALHDDDTRCHRNMGTRVSQIIVFHLIIYLRVHSS